MFFYHLAIQCFGQNAQIMPNLPLVELKDGLEIFSSRKDLLALTVIKTRRILTFKEQKKLLKKIKRIKLWN